MGWFGFGRTGTLKKELETAEKRAKDAEEIAEAAKNKCAELKERLDTEIIAGHAAMVGRTTQFPGAGYLAGKGAKLLRNQNRDQNIAEARKIIEADIQKDQKKEPNPTEE